MKALTSSLIFILCLVSNLFPQTIDDKEAIKKVITESYRALLDKDWDTYSSAWAHKKTSARISISQNRSNEILGWEKLEKYYKSRIEKGSDTSGWVFEYRNFTINVQDNLAWASFDKFVKTGDEMTKQSREYRVLIKEDGTWKNLSMIFVAQN